MKLPNYNDLSDEQLEIYLFEDYDENLMIVGPPGSGKTIMAYYRADAIAEETGNEVHVIMYNNTLRAFSSNALVNPNVKVSTQFTFMNEWWKKFTVWRKPPTNRFVFEWDKMFAEFLEYRKKVDPHNMSWQHLIIDEGQDFPPGMYKFLRNIQKYGLSDCNCAKSITVLADENQRLQSNENSTLKDIKNALEIDDEHLFFLTKNYRNTDEIAGLASYFQVGLASGHAEPSGKHGEIPLLVASASFDKEMEFFLNYVKLHDNQEIGVFVDNDLRRKQVLSILQKELGGFMNIQSYSSRDPEWKNHKKLKFDRQGLISVFNRQSAKGLEFDAVFIMNMEDIRFDPGSVDSFKMVLYVLCTRAREYLTMMYVNSGRGKPGFLDLFENIDSKFLEFKNV